jgi:hypothetical protein
MTPNGFELVISNEYGFELDSFLGAIYLTLAHYRYYYRPTNCL